MSSGAYMLVYSIYAAIYTFCGWLQQSSIDCGTVYVYTSVVYTHIHNNIYTGTIIFSRVYAHRPVVKDNIIAHLW